VGCPRAFTGHLDCFFRGARKEQGHWRQAHERAIAGGLWLSGTGKGLVSLFKAGKCPARGVADIETGAVVLR
jgi:hypothetical protein